MTARQRAGQSPAEDIPPPTVPTCPTEFIIQASDDATFIPTYVTTPDRVICISFVYLNAIMYNGRAKWGTLRVGPFTQRNACDTQGSRWGPNSHT